MTLRGGSQGCGRGRPLGRRITIFPISGLAIVIAIVLVAACAGGPPVAVRPGPFEPLESGVGFLVVQVDSDVGIERLQIDRMVVVRDLQAGQHLWLIRMKEGRYRWSEVRLAPQISGTNAIRTRSVKVLDQREFEFEVEAGKINYPGEIMIRLADPDQGIWAGLTVRNRNHSAIAIRKLLKSHPELVAAHALRYAGTRGDEFLQFYTRARDSRGTQKAGTASPGTGAR